MKKLIKYHKKNNDVEEAVDLGWDEKRYCLKYFLTNNRDALEQTLFPDESGSDVTETGDLGDSDSGDSDTQ